MAARLAPGDALTFDGSAETVGGIANHGGAGTDTLTGGSGNDAFYMTANLSAADVIDGGAGSIRCISMATIRLDAL